MCKKAPVASRNLRPHPCEKEVDNRVNFEIFLGKALWNEAFSLGTTCSQAVDSHRYCVQHRISRQRIKRVVVGEHI